MEKKENLKPKRVIDTLTDVGSVFMATIYILYVVLLLSLGFGTLWLNWCMLAITLTYIIFFITKIVALNRIFEKNNMERTARFVLRYSKWSMKIINAAFVCIAIATTKANEGNILMLVGIFVVGFSFLVSVLWDVTWFIIRKKAAVFKLNWDSLTREEKRNRIEMIFDSLIHNLDNLAGVDITESVVTSTADRRVRKQVREKSLQVPKQEVLSAKDSF